MVAKPAESAPGAVINDGAGPTTDSTALTARKNLSNEASGILASPPAPGENKPAAKSEKPPEVPDLKLASGDTGGESEAEKPKSRALDSSRSPSQLAAEGKIVDKTDPASDKPAVSDQGKNTDKPEIKVSLENKTESETREKPDFLIRSDGTIEMNSDPEKTKSKKVSVLLTRNDSETEPTDAQKQAAEELVEYLAERLSTIHPEAEGVILNDADDTISQETQTESKLEAPADQQKMSEQTREALGRANRLEGISSLNMPRASTQDVMPESRSVPRMDGETDKTAALKEVVSGLFRPDQERPYETVRSMPDGTIRVGRYGFSADQLSFFLEALGDPPDPEMLKRLGISEQFARKLADPNFRQKFKEFVGKLAKGEEVSSDELKEMLPEDAQESIAGVLIDQYSQKTGGQPGQVAAAMLSGKSPEALSASDLATPESLQISQAGETLYKQAERRQATDSQSGQVVGDVPEGDRRALIEKALKLANVAVTPENLAAVNTIVQKESGWNPNAFNDWDSNAKAGIPSQGLMQTIPPTFKQYALPGYDQNIMDPLSNLIAGIRYAESRYGSLQNVPGIRKLAQGQAYVGY